MRDSVQVSVSWALLPAPGQAPRLPRLPFLCGKKVACCRPGFSPPAPPLRPPGAASQAHLVWWASRVIFALSHFGRVNAMINPHRLSKYQHPELWKPRPRKAVLGGLRHMAVHCCTSHCHHQSPSLVWAPGSEKGWLRLQQHPQSGGLRSPRQLRPSPDRSGRGFGDAPSCPQRQAV
ncbi:uncharacterized protein LOC119872802 isoform X2 [Canis lupus familiaris]|uniref:uncharacterized protein LOC119872802 isoform X2 n=1 Tax=Canis lupus familiaris TaxID=9615 RepID=UPI0018F58760|nr:uncharacterized protein LOC119872802 isoform X2 [Canis lupus familiaris]